MPIPLPNLILSDAVPEDELWLITPGEYVQFLKPGEEPYTYSAENIQCKDGTISFDFTRRINGVLVETKKPQMHKIVNIGGNE